MKYFIFIDNKDQINEVKNKINKIDRNAKINTSTELDDIDYNIINSDIIICSNNQTRIKKLQRYNKSFFVYMSNNREELLEESININTMIKEKKAPKVKKKNKLATVFTVLLLLIIATIVIGNSVYQKIQSDQKQQLITKKQNEEQILIEEDEQRKDEQHEDEIQKENYVFLGDSITEMYDLDEYYESIPHIRSGTSGYTTDDILDHMEDYVYRYNPTKVILLIGTNDLQMKDYSNKELLENIRKIVTLIKKNRPKAEIYVESIYPINNTDNSKVKKDMVGKRENERIIELNKGIKKMCSEENVNYINMYDELTDKDGNFNIDYSVDGLHPSEEGFDVITKKLKSVLNIE